jgi:CheY-like chemotaxis protein
LARRILLADDSVTAQNMGRRILSDAGYEVVTVNNGSAALKKIAENKPDIIILDVYMPGYGGLEVCQRVKQDAETARIPILLTVGKLEPFKPDEARRVGADAFIIKPFEATELLTALTKLEDKIVAGPQPQKTGRFARALAAIEGADFGDKETGWKNRLTIPGPNAKTHAAEPEAAELASAAQNIGRGEATPLDARQELERAIPAGLPPDITPEEIAAITAAAASFDGKPAHPTVIPEGTASESIATMQAASAEISAVQSREAELPATLSSAASTAEAEVSPAPEVVAEAAPVVEIAPEVTAEVEAPPATAAEVPAQVSEITSEIEGPPVAAEASSTAVGEVSAGDDEVLAALASLAPTNGRGGENPWPAMGATANDVSQEIPLAATAAVAGITGPRWIAEAVALAAEESAVSLEQEMELATAARVAEEAEASAQAAAATAVEVQVPEQVVEAVAEVSATEVAEVNSAPAEKVSEEGVAEVLSEPVVTEAIAETPVLAESQDLSEPKETSAYAAAASAGAPSDQSPAAEAISQATVTPEITESAPVASTAATPQREAELAAAWENWKHIRESFVSDPKPAAAIEVEAAAAVAAETNATETVDEVEVEEDEDEVSDAPGESVAIASIVDSMLAELRPKLVEEIAKKMNSEKKQKEKKKKK